MSDQDLFEKDYLAAFPTATDLEFARKSKESGAYYYCGTRQAFAVWLQQAKRHEAEIAELVAALKRLHNVVASVGVMNLMNGVQLGAVSWAIKADDAVGYADAVIAKYEVKS